MMRLFNTDSKGNAFRPDVVDAVWKKARTVPGADPEQIRKDPCGAWIERKNFGVTSHKGTGWEIDHILPVERGGTDKLNNLQALQWENNRQKGSCFVLKCYISYQHQAAPLIKKSEKVLALILAMILNTI
ncbi:MAG TPA: HNH endonuclease signature motif containing protein [Ignavibacteriales bacterium]|nr:HNH endonuclease signature motif containing protein [Ignavibacteriales bacterium]